MKKIILMALCLSLASLIKVKAQTYDGEGLRQIKSGIAEPTINGIPYSQYKAQQDALKNQKTAANKVQAPGIATINAGEARPAQVTPQSDPPKFENDGYSVAPAPELVKQEVKEIKPAVKPKPEARSDKYDNKTTNGDGEAIPAKAEKNAPAIKN